MKTFLVMFCYVFHATVRGFPLGINVETWIQSRVTSRFEIDEVALG
jgi:hypothetical protein